MVMSREVLHSSRRSPQTEKLTGGNICKALICSDNLYSVMDDQEKRQIMEALLSEVRIHEEWQSNGPWFKPIKFRLPIIAEDVSLSLDNDTHIESYARSCSSYSGCRVDKFAPNRRNTPRSREGMHAACCGDFLAYSSWRVGKIVVRAAVSIHSG